MQFIDLEHIVHPVEEDTIMILSRRFSLKIEIVYLFHY